MKKLFFALFAAVLMFAGCEQEDPTYSYKDIYFYYPAETTIAQETPLNNGIHLLIKGTQANKMDMDIIELDDSVVNESWEAKEAYVKQEADAMMRKLLNDPAYEWTLEPISHTTKHDRWSADDEIPGSSWDIILAKRNGEPVSLYIYVRLFRNYLVRMLSEGPNQDARGELGTIAYSFHFVDD
ncbi:MAG: hypothetical protein K6G86_05725 [Bacteroidales bacterium]|nr:hypothetical protein [Bacteroidales bacterium]